jgi:hypothetical protein
VSVINGQPVTQAALGTRHRTKKKNELKIMFSRRVSRSS